MSDETFGKLGPAYTRFSHLSSLYVPRVNKWTRDVISADGAVLGKISRRDVSNWTGQVGLDGWARQSFDAEWRAIEYVVRTYNANVEAVRARARH